MIYYPVHCAGVTNIFPSDNPSPTVNIYCRH